MTKMNALRSKYLGFDLKLLNHQEEQQTKTNIVLSKKHLGQRLKNLLADKNIIRCLNDFNRV